MSATVSGVNAWTKSWMMLNRFMGVVVTTRRVGKALRRGPLGLPPRHRLFEFFWRHGTTQEEPLYGIALRLPYDA